MPKRNISYNCRNTLGRPAKNGIWIRTDQVTIIIVCFHINMKTTIITNTNDMTIFITSTNIIKKDNPDLWLGSGPSPAHCHQPPLHHQKYTRQIQGQEEGADEQNYVFLKLETYGWILKPAWQEETDCWLGKGGSSQGDCNVDNGDNVYNINVDNGDQRSFSILLRLRFWEETRDRSWRTFSRNTAGWWKTRCFLIRMLMVMKTRCLLIRMVMVKIST